VCYIIVADLSLQLGGNFVGLSIVKVGLDTFQRISGGIGRGKRALMKRHYDILDS